MRNEKKYLIYGIGLVLIVLIGVTFAYFTAQIIGDTKEISVTTADLKVIFTNGEAITGAEIEPGWSITKTFSVENKTKGTYNYNIVIKDLVNTTTTYGYLKYKITSTNDGYNMSEFVDVPKSTTATDTILVYSVSIPKDVIQEYTIEIVYENDENVDQSEDMGKTISGNLFISEGEATKPKLTEKLLADNGTILTREDFSVPFTTTNTGTFYQATEKVGDSTATVYYFAGDAKNNWVKFGKTTEASCTYNGVEVEYYDENMNMLGITSEAECHTTNVCDAATIGLGYVIGVDEATCTNPEMANGTYLTEQATWNASEKDTYWRIIRTNEDGSVRLLYAGTSPNTTKGYIGESRFNTNGNDPMYVGYMYGTSGSLENNRTNENSSTIKTYIDNWYQSNLLTNYDKYISREAVYCNDRSITNGTYSTSSNFYYAPYTRLRINKTPTYNCSDTNDMFTTSDSTVGNKKLTYPIALMTADELAFAGGKDNTTLESPYAWYYTNAKGESITGTNWWWTMAPIEWYGSLSFVWGVDGSDGPGDLYGGGVSGPNAVRASVSLKSCNLISKGDGRASNPYEIYYGESCTE